MAAAAGAAVAGIAATAVVSGCGDDAGTADAGAVDAPARDGGAGIVVAPPDDPSPPVLTPCPMGWVARPREDGTPSCEPFGGAAIAECADGEIQLPSDPACRSLGATCPADGVPTGLPADATIVHVRAGSAAGDGSPTAPFGTIGEAVAAAVDGAVIAIGPGVYDEAIVLTRPVTLWGACTAEVLLTSSVPDAPTRAGVVTVETPGASVKNLSVGESERPALWVAVAGAELAIEAVVVRAADRVGIEIENGAHVDARALVVRDTKAGATGQFGRGIGVQSGASATIGARGSPGTTRRTSSRSETGRASRSRTSLWSRGWRVRRTGATASGCWCFGARAPRSPARS